MASLLHGRLAGGGPVPEAVEAEAMSESPRRGRPATGRRDPGVPRRLRVPTALYDKLCRIALRDDISIHAVILRAAAREARIYGSPENRNSVKSS